MPFSPAVEAALATEQSLSQDSINDVTKYYEENYHKIPGAPPSGNITPELALAASAICSFKPDVDKDWAGICTRMQNMVTQDLDAVNPFMPGWFAKTDDRANCWVNDTSDLPSDLKTKLNTILRQSTPARGGSVVDAFSTTPVDDMDYLTDVIAAMMRIAPVFAYPLGDGDSENFRWAPALCMIGGLSPTALRMFSQAMTGEEAWQHWGSCDDDAIVKDILDARKISGYPAGLLRCDAPTLIRMFDGLALVNPAGMPVHPRWFKALIALHIIKHTRLYSGSTPSMFVAYGGEFNILPLSPEGLHQNLWCKESRPIAKILCQTLQLPFNESRNGRTWMQDIVTDILQKIHPLYLPSPRPVTAYPDIVVGPGVLFSMSSTRRSELGWCRPQISVTGVLRLDYQNERVDRDACATGTQIFNLQWPTQTTTASELANWKHAIPTDVRPERISSFASRLFRNWNRLTNSDGVDAMLDAAITIDLYREALAGSSVGAAARIEYPLIFALPMGSNTDDTTNQGKSTFAILLANVVNPAIRTDLCRVGLSTSAPAMRSAMEPLYKYGTAIYDEFIMPDKDHVLNQAGLQSLATGCRASAGRVMENDSGVKLLHPLFFSAKLMKNVKDVHNRMIPLFMDVLTDGTRCTDEQLEDVTSGKASIRARWNHLLWCHKYRILAQLEKSGLASGSAWRFPAHLTAARIFGSAESVKKYVEESARLCEDNLCKAEASGLAENIGVTAGFDPMFFFHQMHDMTVEQLVVKAKSGPMDVLDVLREVVEDCGLRTFSSALRGATESSAKHRFIAAFKRSPDNTLHSNGYAFKWIASSKSDWKINGEGKAHITVTKDAPNDK